MDEGLLKPGAVLNNTYQIEELVGEGGTGEVYRAVNTASQRTVAIKILKEQFSQDPKFIDLMRRELLHNVSDVAVVRYYDLLRTADDQGGLYFLVMDYIDGPSVADLMNKGRVPVETLMILAKRVTQGLAACHNASIFHRDISPDNIILRDGDPAQATLIDFGIAKDVRPDAKTVVGGGFAGKYEYAAPEQLDGIADSRSDIYSFGMTLIAAARGESPKLGTSFLEIVKAKHAAVDTSDVEEPLRSLVDAMVRPDPETRPQTAAELLRMVGGEAPRPAAIETFLEEEASAEPPVQQNPIRTQKPASVKKKGKGGLVAALIMLGVIGGGGVYALGPGKEFFRDLFVPLPTAKPYVMNLRYDGASASVSGNAPSAESAAKLATTLSSRLSAELDGSAITPAEGAPNTSWQATVTAMASELARLDEGTIEFRDDQITFSGQADSTRTKSLVENKARTIAKNGQYRIALSVTAPPPTLIEEAKDNEPEPPTVALLTPPETEPSQEPPKPESTTTSTPPGPIVEDAPDSPSLPEVADAPIPSQDQSSTPEEPELADAPIKPDAPAALDNPAESGAPDAPRIGEGPSQPTSSNPDEVETAILLVTPPTPALPDLLSQRAVDTALNTIANCGPLSARASGSRGFETTEAIRVTGDVGTEEDLASIQETLGQIADERKIDTTRVEVLNPSVCAIKEVMPPRNLGTTSLLYYSARTGAVVQGDALKPNDQAVVYFSAPKDLEGNLYVFVTDNEFNTIHLYPMQTRPETQLSKIGTIVGDERRVQLSWPLSEGSRKQPVLAFTEPYGIAMMFVVLLEDKKLFPHVRAGVEDTRELVPTLAEAIEKAGSDGDLLAHIQRFILVDEE